MTEMEHGSAKGRVIAQWGSAIVGGLAALAGVGTLYQAVAAGRDAQAYPPPGELADVGGHRLHMLCTGTGSPTVVLDCGLNGTLLDWSYVQPLVAAFTRVCAYVRAGHGWSDPGPRPRTSQRIAQELHTLLTRLCLRPTSCKG